MIGADVILSGLIRGLRETCGVMREWVRGRHRIAREREERATTGVVLAAMRPGVLWLDKEGDRLRLITDVNGQQGDFVAQLEKAGALPLSEQNNGRPANP